MTIYLPQSAGIVESYTTFEGSKAQELLELSEQVGLKVILHDSRLYGLSQTKDTLIGDGKRFATQAALDEYVAFCLASYRAYPAFYGVMLADEPSYDMATAYGQIYRSIKRVCPEAFVQYNLLPMTINLSDERYPTLTAEESAGLEGAQVRQARYKKYLQAFIDATGADYVQYDQYPMNGSDIYQTYIEALQVAAEVARDNGIALNIVTQTMKMGNQGGVFADVQREMAEADFYWLNNMLVGFGVKQIAYFTYWTKQASNSQTWFYDGYSFINNAGEKTYVYGIMQKIMAEEQKLAPAILPYSYSTSNVYSENVCGSHDTHLGNTFSGRAFAKVTDVSLDDEIALVTELTDGNGKYAYMVQNISDPICTHDSNTMQAVTLTFAADVKEVEVWVKGEKSVVSLVNGTLTISQTPGAATYIFVK